MKRRLLLVTTVFLGITFITWALKAQQSQQEKEVLLKLTKGEVEVLYSIIDESATPGQVRKPLLRKIEIAYSVAFPQQIQPQPKDTTNKTKKN